LLEHQFLDHRFLDFPLQCGLDFIGHPPR
jgi:hypothetical protein